MTREQLRCGCASPPPAVLAAPKTRLTFLAGIMGSDVGGVTPMRLVADPRYGEVDLSASAEELALLASVVVQGEGLLGSTLSPGDNDLAGVEVKGLPAPASSSTGTPSGRSS